MSTFEEIVASRATSKRKPPKTTRLQPNDFASSWDNRPVEPIEIGLRLPSEDDIQTARVTADKRVEALEFKDPISTIEAWNDALMACTVARSLCDANDVYAESPVLPLAEDTITLALTTNAIRRVYDELERLVVEQSPLAIEATDEELHDLAERIRAGAFERLAGTDAKDFRRFARYCLEFLPDVT